MDAVFEKITRYSLVLLNESLSATTMGERLYLAPDVLRVPRQVGLGAVFTSQMDELATAVHDLSVSTPGDSQVVSMVACCDTGEAGQAHAKARERSLKLLRGLEPSARPKLRG